jgi:hypothetical protein
MITETNSDETTMMISVDNGPERSVSLNTPNRVYQVVVFDTGTQPAGTHTIRARSTDNAFFIVDAFEFSRSGTGGGTGPITSALPGNKCIDVNGSSTANGTRIQLSDCNGGTNQQWTLTDGAFVQAGKCMDVSGANTANGTVVQLWDCHGGTNQQWTPQADGSIKSVQSGRCLDVPASNTTNGTQLVIWDCNGGTNQKWTSSASNRTISRNGLRGINTL